MIAPPWLEIQPERRRYGGIENVVDNCVRNLSDFGVSSQIIFGHPGSRVLQRRLKNTIVKFPPGEEYKRDDLLRLLLRRPRVAEAMENRFLTYAYDQCLRAKDSISVVHDHTDSGREIAGTYSEDFPIVRTEHNSLLYLGKSLGRREELHDKLVRQLYERDSFPKGQFYVAISESQRSQMSNLPWIAVVHNGINLDEFDFRAEKKGNSRYGGKYLLALGRVTKKKGVHNAIAVANALNMPLVIAGQVEALPEAKRYYRRRIKPKLNERIIHLDRGVNVRERKKLMRDASALLMMIEWDEPFGLVAAEANASGTPVVAYRKGAIPEIIEDGKTGYLVNNLKEAIEATEKAIDGKIDPAECRKRIELNFSGEVMTAKLVKVYREAEMRFKGQSKETGLMKFKFPQQP